MLVSRPVTTEAELLELWRNGDQTAGDRLVEHNFDFIYRFFRFKADGNDVSDLVQRTFLAAVEGRERVKTTPSMRAYLLGIARNHIYDYWKDKRRDRTLDVSVSALHDLGPSPSTLAAEKGARRLLLEGLRRIPLDLQIALELHYFEQMSGPEISEVLGIPEGTVRSRLRRGIESVRKAVEGLGESGEILESTRTNLETWAAALREEQS